MNEILFLIFAFLTVFLSVKLSYYADRLSKTSLVSGALIGGIVLGRNTKEKAYLEGIKYTVPYILFCVIWMIIFGYKFNLGVMVLSLVYLLGGIIGTIIGINLKKN